MDVVRAVRGISFVWDARKALLNQRKHGIPFEIACEVFFDPFIRTEGPERWEAEERLDAIGLTEEWQCLHVTFVLREESVRIVSARPATRRERGRYEAG